MISEDQKKEHKNMDININDILEVELKRERQFIEALNELQLDEQSKWEVRQRTYQSYKSIIEDIELENA